MSILRGMKLIYWLKKRLVYIISSAVVLLLLYLFILIFYASNTRYRTEVYDLYLEEGTTYYQLLDKLNQENILHHTWLFRLACQFYGLEDNLKNGLFELPHAASNRQLIKTLTTPQRESVMMPIGPYHFRKYLINGLTSVLDIKDRPVRYLLNEDAFVKSIDSSYTTENIYTIFINDTIPVYKDVRKDELIRRIHRNYQRFWTLPRLAAAKRIGLDPKEVMIMASIVMAETKKPDEMAKVAGLYMNRLNDNIRLQADPTVLYANGQRPLSRILRWHTKIQHPYNTYRNEGLPPGPVHTPSPQVIDAVLHHEDHEYYFFCAKPDKSGYHSFCKTYEEHKQIARDFRSNTYKKK